MNGDTGTEQRNDFVPAVPIGHVLKRLWGDLDPSELPDCAVGFVHE